MKLLRDFFNPKLSLAERRINVDPETRQIALRVASFTDVHGGFKGAVSSPSKVNLEAAHTGEARLEDGQFLKVAQLPMGTLHASGNLLAEEARQVYENTGRSVARVRYSVDEDGIRADGVLYDDVDEDTMDRLLASAPSGDWRAMTHIRKMDDIKDIEADFIGTAIVNIPGFSNTYTQAAGTPLRLVASAGDEEIILVEDAAPAEECAAAADADAPACSGCSCGKAGASLTAGADGLTAEDIRAAWDRQFNVKEGSSDVPVGSEYGWVADVYIEPRKVVVELEGKYFEQAWDEAGDEIVFGERVEVEKVWVPATLTAAAGTETATVDAVAYLQDQIDILWQLYWDSVAAM